jgi:hypothetical protein
MAASLLFMRRLLLCVIGAALLGACGDNTITPPAAAPAASASASAATTPATAPGSSSVPDSLAFSAPRVGGGTVNLADYAGKPVLLWFWAPT